MLAPVIGGFVNIPPGGDGASAVQSLVWTWANGNLTDPVAGTFTTDSNYYDGTSQIYLSEIPKGGGPNVAVALTQLTGTCQVFFVNNTTGKIYSYTAPTIVGTVDYLNLSSLNARGVEHVMWSGDYSLVVVPAPSLLDVLTKDSITPVSDGTYTVGIGGSQNGTITTRNGVITAVQEAQP